MNKQITTKKFNKPTGMPVSLWGKRLRRTFTKKSQPHLVALFRRNRL